jgi:hypothetical protein
MFWVPLNSDKLLHIESLRHNIRLRMGHELNLKVRSSRAISVSEGGVMSSVFPVCA